MSLTRTAQDTGSVAIIIISSSMSQVHCRTKACHVTRGTDGHSYNTNKRLLWYRFLLKLQFFLQQFTEILECGCYTLHRVILAKINYISSTKSTDTQLLLKINKSIACIAVYSMHNFCSGSHHTHKGRWPRSPTAVQALVSSYQFCTLYRMKASKYNYLVHKCPALAK